MTYALSCQGILAEMVRTSDFSQLACEFIVRGSEMVTKCVDCYFNAHIIIVHQDRHQIAKAIKP